MLCRSTVLPNAQCHASTISITHINSTALKITCAPPIIPLLSSVISLATTDLLLSLYFCLPGCLIVGIVQYVGFSNWFLSLAAAAKLCQSCPTLCDPIDGSQPGSHVPGILQARTLEWVAISFSNAWKWEVKVKSLSPVQLLATPWTAAYQALPSVGFSRQEYWSGVPLPSPNNLLLQYN